MGAGYAGGAGGAFGLTGGNGGGGPRLCAAKGSGGGNEAVDSGYLLAAFCGGGFAPDEPVLELPTSEPALEAPPRAGSSLSARLSDPTVPLSERWSPNAPPELSESPSVGPPELEPSPRAGDCSPSSLLGSSSSILSFPTLNDWRMDYATHCLKLHCC